MICILYLLTDLYDLFISLGFYVTFNTVQVISRWVVVCTEETSTYNWLSFCTVYCRPTVSDYHFYHISSGIEPQTSEVGGECVTTAQPLVLLISLTYTGYIIIFWEGLCVFH